MKLKMGIFLVISVLLITFTFYGFQICYAPNVLVGKENRELIIPENTSYNDLLIMLDKKGFVNDLVSFSFLARLYDLDRAIKVGRYVLMPDMNNLELIKTLKGGLQTPVNVTFGRVRLIPELSERITRNIDMEPADFEAALIKFVQNNGVGFDADNIMCMFLPNTYQVYYTIEPDAFISRMHREFELFWSEARRKKAESIGLTPIEVYILASIVQAETVKNEEAPKIAGLYVNRLKKDMLLQADPTVVFAVGDFTLKRVLNRHKEVNSKYNTYKYRGLPPGPINMPEIGIIDAVLNYEHHPYLYMCAKEDFSGFHRFTKSYSEHLQNAAKYQRALTIEQRKAKMNR